MAKNIAITVLKFSRFMCVNWTDLHIVNCDFRTHLQWLQTLTFQYSGLYCSFTLCFILPFTSSLSLSLSVIRFRPYLLYQPRDIKFKCFSFELIENVIEHDTPWENVAWRSNFQLNAVSRSDFARKFFIAKISSHQCHYDEVCLGHFRWNASQRRIQQHTNWWENLSHRHRCRRFRLRVVAVIEHSNGETLND